jgi:hypothetical protein
MSICAKTRLGKSLIPLSIMSMRRGVGIFQVPLVGLGTDQVSKALHVGKNIEAIALHEMISYEIISCEAISYEIISYKIISYEIISYKIASYEMIPMRTRSPRTR